MVKAVSAARPVDLHLARWLRPLPLVTMPHGIPCALSRARKSLTAASGSERRAIACRYQPFSASKSRPASGHSASQRTRISWRSEYPSSSHATMRATASSRPGGVEDARNSAWKSSATPRKAVSLSNSVLSRSKRMAEMGVVMAYSVHPEPVEGRREPHNTTRLTSPASCPSPNPSNPQIGSYSGLDSCLNGCVGEPPIARIPKVSQLVETTGMSRASSCLASRQLCARQIAS